MRLKWVRAGMVVGAFALFAGLTLARSILVDTGAELPLAVQTAPGFGLFFLRSFRYYLAWAVMTPFVLWLGRRVRFTSRRWLVPLLIHAAAAAFISIPVVGLVVVFAGLLGGLTELLAVLTTLWPRIVVIEVAASAPVYAVVLGIGAVFQFHRDHQAQELQAIELQRSLATVQLDALRTKLQPQFLFATLSAVDALARAGDTASVARVIEHLGRLLRLSMETGGRDFVTLDEELALLDEYLSIEAIRFGSRLTIGYRIDVAARKALIPNLILPPLVENVISHAVAGRTGPATIELAAARQGSQLWLEVRDDGPGLPAGWTLASTPGRGLRNVDDRLRAIYGGGAHLSVRAREPHGTVARITVPCVDQPVDALED